MVIMEDFLSQLDQCAGGEYVRVVAVLAIVLHYRALLSFCWSGGTDLVAE